MKITRENLKNIVREAMIEENEYQTFFKKALEKTGKSIPDMSDEEKKAFFNKIDSAWKGKGEKNEGNAFGAAVADAKKDGDDSFKVGGKEYKVESNEEDLDEEAVVVSKRTPEGNIVSKLKEELESVNEGTKPKFKVGDMVKYKGAKVSAKVLKVMPTNWENGYLIQFQDNKKKEEAGESSLVKESVNEALSVDPRKVYGGTGAKEGMVLISQKGLMKILDLSKKNPSNVFLVSDDNYTNFGPYYVKNGKVAKYTVANPNYDLEKNKVRTLKVPSDVILKFKIMESVNERIGSDKGEVGNANFKNRLSALKKSQGINKGDKVVVNYPNLTKPVKGVVFQILKSANGNVIVLKDGRGVWDEKFVTKQ